MFPFSSILVPLQDGLGNQLFQYAHGILLRETAGAEVLFDDRFFTSEWGGNRRYGLDAFVADVPKVPHAPANRLDGGRLKWLNGWNRRRMEAGKKPIGPVLLGNSYAWQNRHDVDAVARVLRRDLVFRESAPWATDGSRKTLGEIQAGENSVMVHVRRGDYVDNRIFDVCGPDYYRAAAKRAQSEIPEASFHVFSEDPAWCRRELSGLGGRWLFHEPGDERGDLRLMASCRHHILANSTYSWWAAWLGRKEGQHVYRPAVWYNDATGNEKAMKDLVYPDWIGVQA